MFKGKKTHGRSEFIIPTLYVNKHDISLSGSFL